MLSLTCMVALIWCKSKTNSAQNEEMSRKYFTFYGDWRQTSVEIQQKRRLKFSRLFSCGWRDSNSHRKNSHYPLKVARLPFRHIRLWIWDCKDRHKLYSCKIFCPNFRPIRVLLRNLHSQYPTVGVKSKTFSIFVASLLINDIHIEGV